MKTIKPFLLLAAMGLASTVMAQQPRLSSSIYLLPQAKTDVVVPFRPTDSGIQLPIRWGLDVAWNSEQNMRKGINFIGKENLSIARSSFQMNQELIGDTALTHSQIQALRSRTNTINLMGADVDMVLNADQGNGSTEFIIPYYTQNNVANTNHWARLIDASVAWMQKNYPRHKIVAVSPFNEPDYTPWNEGTKANFKEIARQLKEDYPRFKDIAITAGNTLNNDYAAEWYNAVKPYATWGNTHQLAGEFNTFTNFWKQVVDEGNVAYADELHNVGEAMIAANYGISIGIWWGFDSRARGEFCQISNHGSRLAYGEDRSHWTAASVYRDDATKELKAFVGGSERQAANSSYLFVSPDEDVYFDGQGPTRAFRMEYPGGTGYQKGQTNAERVYNIYRGEDVPPMEITAGRYKLINYAARTLVVGNASSGNDLNMKLFSQLSTIPLLAQWDVAPADARIGGDYSFHTFTNAQNQMHMNVVNNSTSAFAHVISYNANNASNEQWSLHYAGKGYYYIRNRESGLYLSMPNESSTYAVQKLLASSAIDRRLQMWRFIPEDGAVESSAPNAPTNLIANAQSASVALSWTAPADDDVHSYNVVRGEADGSQWSTIARGITATSFTDNTCRQGHTYIYKVKAIDRSANVSAMSEPATASPTAQKTLVASWQMEGDLHDATVNMMDATCSTAPRFMSEHRVGDSALRLSNNYLRLPYEVGDMDEFTIAMWVKWTNASNNWTRLFDFGNGTSNYMFLTPSNGSNMRFAIKNGGEEQTVDANGKLQGNKWHHVAVTMGEGNVTLWVDGEAVGSSSSVTIKPSDIRPVLNYIGRSQFDADPLFSGLIDDIRLYNYPLTAQELQSVIGNPTGVDRIEGDDNANAASTYNLSGQRVGSNHHGVTVSKGKKWMRK